ncbi:MAG: DUF4097 domain-containing protein [Thermoleophilia bacterium]
MTTFSTPGPVLIALDLGSGDVRITAGDRADTVVEVRPRDPSSDEDVAAAGRTRVDLADGRLSITTAKGPLRLPWKVGHEAVDVDVAVPAGSRLDGAAKASGLTTSGRLGEVRFTTGYGDVRLDETGPVRARSGAGDVAVEHAAGPAEVSTGTGAIAIGTVEGAVTVKNSNGDTRIGDAGGDVAVKAANGRITIGRARAGVVARSANGDIAIGAVERGSVAVTTAAGSIDVAVADGVPAWLDLSTGYGTVRNDLDDAERPGDGEETVEVRARTGAGDVTARRAVAVM